jgi:modulator of FtsH protease HflK
MHSYPKHYTMNPKTLSPAASGLRGLLSRMFNLNDSNWGRGEGGDGKPHSDSSDEQAGRPRQPEHDNVQPIRGGGQRPNNNDGPPDLDELWRDFNQRLGGLFGGKNGRSGNGGNGGSGGNGGGMPPSFTPDGKSAGVGVGLIAGVSLLIWLGTGFFIVQEGQQAVITQFGRYHTTVGAGFNWRMPAPIQAHELVFVTQIRSVDVGSDQIVRATGLRESAMLTSDENIVEIKFAVQYRLSDSRAYLFESRDPDAAVVKAAETAVREVVGKMKMDSALAEERDQIAPRVRDLMQVILDRYKVGIEVVGVNLQQGGVRPPEQVQASFDDVLKAAQERERAKNEAQAYANDVVPRAGGAAARLRAEAEAYRERIVAQAEGDSKRFESVLGEYKKSPQVTRDRLYVDTMQSVYSNVSKVLVESRNGSNLLYLPLDKLIQNVGPNDGVAPLPSTSSSSTSNLPPTLNLDGSRARSPDAARSRDLR